MKKVCVITTTRADYGLLKNLIHQIDIDKELELCLVVTGTHLVREFGMTVSEITGDGFTINERIDILLAADTPIAISKTMGLAFFSFAEMFQRQNPDMIIVLGDRYELLPICACALNAGIPIAHISGGETTEGAIDDIIRHCVTKMSYLHFPGCELYRKRIIQLGESPERVFNFGDIGVEAVKLNPIMPKKELEAALNFKLDPSFMCVTFHPVTMEYGAVRQQCKELLSGIDSFPNIRFIFTKANADMGGRIVNEMVAAYVKDHSNCALFDSLGFQKYISCLYYSNGVIGNSSSGIVEAPTIGIPTINIGNRQKGRLQATSIINCKAEHEELIKAIKLSQTKEFLLKSKNTVNPYGVGNTSEKIVKTIKEFLKYPLNISKSFYDLPSETRE